MITHIEIYYQCSHLTNKDHFSKTRIHLLPSDVPPTPGIAGHAAADDGVEHGRGDVPPVEEAVHPLVREHISRVDDC